MRVHTLRSTRPWPRIHSWSLCFEVLGAKRNSKSSNVSGAVVVRCTALKMGAFSSSCSKLCNEWSLMSVRRAEAELRWFKRNRESTGDDAGEHWGRVHTAGDHVLVTAILSAIFIVVLVYLLVLGQPFRFRSLERAGTPSSTATSASWVHAWSVENKTFARFSQHRLLQRQKQQHCRRQRSDRRCNA